MNVGIERGVVSRLLIILPALNEYGIIFGFEQSVNKIFPVPSCAFLNKLDHHFIVFLSEK